jgi:cytochrome bd-type quinol oxidase subunit 2
VAVTEKETPRTRLIAGPGILLVWLYGVMVVGAVSRSAYQIATEFDRAPLAYTLSALAGVVYGFITYTLVRGGETARRAARICCAAELAGVLIVGTWTMAEPSAFPDATVWSDYGMGYLFIPVLLPVSALYWLRGSRQQGAG